MEIDITKELIAFEKHLRNNERVILSAKFGDGKTYFLDAFKKKFSAKENDQQQYEFITLYPINYQVSDNKEIFEYIKRDILIQMVLKGMIHSGCQISEGLYLQFYLMNNHLTLVQDIIQIIPSLGLIYEGIDLSGFMGTIMTGLKALSFLKDQKEKYKKFKEDIESMDDIALAESFCNKFAKEKGGCYELDLITEIIIQSIQKYKEDHNKKVVLVIEDMDRLDPAHLFRLLNIFSAHLDRYNIYKNTPEFINYTLSNKFGFDNIITVFDYDNARKIFAHFYGEKTNFEGYINKFTSGAAFRYSIYEIAKEQLNQIFKEECGFGIFIYFKIKNPKSNYQDTDNLSIRDIQKIISKYKENLSQDLYTSKAGFQIHKTNSLTTLISILKLMGLDNHKIKLGILSLPDKMKLNCIGCYLLEIPDILNVFSYNNSRYEITKRSEEGPIKRIFIDPISSPIRGQIINDQDLEYCIDIALGHV